MRVLVQQMFSGEHVESSTIPYGFVRLSDAIGRLADGMWGGLRRPAPVQDGKRAYKRASIGFGPWRERPGKELAAAVKKGKVDVYVCAIPQVLLEDGHFETMAVPGSVLARLITTRGSLPDHPIRPSIMTTAGDAKLLRLLTIGILAIRTTDLRGTGRNERKAYGLRNARNRTPVAPDDPPSAPKG
jgi:hypothetical protein